MQYKYYQILLGRTYEWLLWRGGHFIEAVFKKGSTVVNVWFNYSQEKKTLKTFYVKNDIYKTYNKKLK